MSTTVSDIIRETKALVETKQAEFRKKAAIAGGDGSDYPGAECDKPVPAGAGSANAEVKEELPEGGTSTTGACDAEKTESGHAKDSTQPADASVTKKPQDTADAMAKKASEGTTKLANDLMSRIRAHQEKIASAETKVATETKAAKSCDGDGQKPKDGKPDMKETKKTPAPKKEEGEDKMAGNGSIELTTDVLAKIASVILSTEEGIEFVEQQMTKAAGAEAAVETMEFLQKQAAYEAGAADAEALIYQAYMQKQAEAQYEAEMAARGQYTKDDLEKAAQALADEILATGGEEEGDMGTGEDAGAVMGDIADGGGLGDISPEELEQAIAMMVAEGTLDEQTAAAILEALGAGGGEGEAMPPEAGAAEAEMAAGAPAEEEEEVTAEALEEKIASTILKIRAKRK